jgi:hypothetical protein
MVHPSLMLVILESRPGSWALALISLRGGKTQIRYCWYPVSEGYALFGPVIETLRELALHTVA